MPNVHPIRHFPDDPAIDAGENMRSIVFLLRMMEPFLDNSLAREERNEESLSFRIEAIDFLHGHVKTYAAATETIVDEMAREGAAK